MAEKHNQPKEALEGVGDVNLGGIEYKPEKSTWPEVVGLTSEDAVTKIKEEVAAGTQILVIPQDSFVTMDYRTDRVRIFINSSGKVDKPPTIA